MSKLIRNLLAIGLLLPVLIMTVKAEDSAIKVSEFGKYSGYSKAIYNGRNRTSQYVEMSDGNKIAIDIMTPAIDGKAATEKCPVILTMTPYGRSNYGSNNNIATMVEDIDLQKLIYHGYIIIAADIRGTGGSLDSYRGMFSKTETKDTYDLIEWIAKQPWNNGKVGMVGGSYQGITQLMVAALKPPHLKAVFPEVALFDLYSLLYPGGVYRIGLATYWGQMRHRVDTFIRRPIVDGDKSGIDLMRARLEHKNGWKVVEETSVLPYRDSVSKDFTWIDNSPSGHLSEINEAKIPAYFSGGWMDIFASDQLLWYANYQGPKKMMIGGWAHNFAGLPEKNAKERQELVSTEELRWFDYWLKDIDNGIMVQNPINYTILTDIYTSSWHESKQWPPENIKNKAYYFIAGNNTDNANILSLEESSSENAFNTYGIDYTASSASMSRWSSAVGAGPLKYLQMNFNDAKCLTYTTDKLTEDTTVIGFPVVTLYVTSTSKDYDFHVLLEDVDEQGNSNYVTEGILRASLRKQTTPPWDNFDLPYQSCKKEDVEYLSLAEISKIEFCLIPTSWTFVKGHKIRVAIMGADEGNTQDISLDTAPTIKIFTNKLRGSNIILPIRQK